MFRYKSKYKTVGVLSIRIVKSNVSSVGPSSEINVSKIIFVAFLLSLSLYICFRTLHEIAFDVSFTSQK